MLSLNLNSADSKASSNVHGRQKAQPAPPEYADTKSTEDVADAGAAATGKGQMSAKDAFKKFDKDNDGSLTFDEMVFAMRAMGITMDKDKLKVI